MRGQGESRVNEGRGGAGLGGRKWKWLGREGEGKGEAERKRGEVRGRGRERGGDDQAKGERVHRNSMNLISSVILSPTRHSICTYVGCYIFS